jgi:hypothetical protein
MLSLRVYTLDFFLWFKEHKILVAKRPSWNVKSVYQQSVNPPELITIKSTKTEVSYVFCLKYKIARLPGYITYNSLTLSAAKPDTFYAKYEPSVESNYDYTQCPIETVYLFGQ